MWNSSGKSASFLIAAMAIGAIVHGVCAKSRSVVEENIALKETNFVVRLIIKGHGTIVACSGAIIGTRHVITASACFDTVIVNHVLVLGGVDNNNDKKFNSIKTSSYCRHPEASSSSFMDQLVILELDEELDLCNRYSKVLLPTRKPDVNENGVMYTWNTCSNTRVIVVNNTTVSFVEQTNCRSVSSSDDASKLLCVDMGSSTVCPDDIGGPIVSNGHLVGIMTSGVGSKRGPFMAQSIYHYVDWINNAMQSDLCPESSELTTE